MGCQHQGDAYLYEAYWINDDQERVVTIQVRCRTCDALIREETLSAEDR